MKLALRFGFSLLLAAVALTAVSTGRGAAQGACDPSYLDFCIPAPPPDLDCDEIAYRDFHVQPPDPHAFDGNHDGIGCESGTFGPGIEPPDRETPITDGTATPRPTATPAISPPNAGFGERDVASGNSMTWFVAALLGAGVAWLAVGLAGAAVQAHAPARGGGHPAMKPMASRRRHR